MICYYYSKECAKRVKEVTGVQLQSYIVDLLDKAQLDKIFKMVSTAEQQVKWLYFLQIGAVSLFCMLKLKIWSLFIKREAIVGISFVKEVLVPLVAILH